MLNKKHRKEDELVKNKVLDKIEEINAKKEMRFL